MGGSPLQVRYTNSGSGGGGGGGGGQSTSGGGGGGGGETVLFRPIPPPPPLPRTSMYSRNQEEPTMMHERVQCTVRNDRILEI